MSVGIIRTVGLVLKVSLWGRTCVGAPGVTEDEVRVVLGWGLGPVGPRGARVGNRRGSWAIRVFRLDVECVGPPWLDRSALVGILALASRMLSALRFGLWPFLRFLRGRVLAAFGLARFLLFDLGRKA